PAMSTATSGVAEQDAGIASATVNAAQQVGGALGLAVLGTVAATATGIQAYTLVFHVTAAVYVGAAAICWSLLRPRLADRLHAAPAVPIRADGPGGRARWPAHRAVPGGQPSEPYQGRHTPSSVGAVVISSGWPESVRTKVGE